MAVVERRFGRLLYGRTDFLWQDDGSCVLTELERRVMTRWRWFAVTASAADSNSRSRATTA